MNSKRHSLNKIVFFNFLSTLVLQGLTFFTSPLFSRMLGAENYGIVSVYLIWTNIASILFTLQPASSLVMARKEYPLQDQEKYQSSTLFMSFCVYSLCALIVIIFINPISKLIQLSPFVIIMLLCQGFGASCVGFLNTKQTHDFRADKNAILTITIAISNVAFSVLLIKMLPKEDNYLGRVCGQAFVYIVAAILICWSIWRKGKTFVNLQYWKFAAAMSIPLIFHALAGLIVGQSDRVMLQWLGGNASAGIYSLASNFSAAISSVWSALNNSWVPFFFEYMRTDRADEVKKHAKNYLELFTVLSSGFVLLTMEVYHLFASSEYWSGTDIIYALALSHYFTFLYSFAVNYELYYKKTKVVAVGTMLAACVNVVLNLFMIHFWGAIGAAIATALSMLIKCIFHHINAKRIDSEMEYPFKLRLFVPYTVAFLCMIGATLMLQDLWWARWGLGACIGVWELYRVFRRKAIF